MFKVDIYLDTIKEKKYIYILNSFIKDVSLSKSWKGYLSVDQANQKVIKF